jgi:hypothetical protein
MEVSSYIWVLVSIWNCGYGLEVEFQLYHEVVELFLDVGVPSGFPLHWKSNLKYFN